MKLAITLRFYSTGDFYGPLGDLFGISKSAVEYIIAHVSWLIASRLRQRFIRMPSTRDEIISAKIDFMRLPGFPMCITAIDGTHVQVTSFGGQNAEVYRNRKTTFSLNVQLSVSAEVLDSLNFCLHLINKLANHIS